MTSRAARTGVALAFAAVTAGAQAASRAEPSAADREISLGRLAAAESELYAASRRAPRDPAARGALGNFLAARGRLKAGAVLLEEARQFGGDARIIDAHLAHIYRWQGDWEQIAALPATTANDGVRALARWLAQHPGSVTGPDSSVIALAPNEIAGLGRIAVGIGGTVSDADIDPSIEGLVLVSTPAALAATQLFGTQDGSTIGAAFAVTFGAYTLTNVPVRLEPGGRVRVGLDVLAPLYPTFDHPAKRIILRTPAPSSLPGVPMPLFLTFPGVKIVPRDGQRLAALDTPAGRAALRGVRWTFDLRRGALMVER